MKESPDFLKDLVSEGIHFFPFRFDPERCSGIFREILKARDLGGSMFLSEEDYDRNPVHFGVNPVAGFNMVERFERELKFIEDDPRVVERLGLLLGEGYQIFNKKLVCAIPEARIPGWLIGRLSDNPTNCLNAYIKPAYRDLTYLYGSDFHMDVVDRFKWPDGSRRIKFITMYVNLCEVTKAEAPLIVMPASHLFGATVFPHELEMRGADTWRYSDGKGRSTECRHVLLTGMPGTSAMWHSCLLHGAPRNLSLHPRISLRYIIGPRSEAAPCGLDEVNRSVQGPLFLEDWEYRTDLDKQGRPQTKHVSAIGRIPLA